MEDVIQLILEDYRKGRDIDETAPAGRPAQEAVQALIEQLRILIFPGYFREDEGRTSLESYIAMVLARVRFRLEGQILPLLRRELPEAAAEEKTRRLCREFLGQIPRIRELMQGDLEAFLAGDPAAAGREEIIASYPGFYAITVYRLAHALQGLGVAVLPRMMTEFAHGKTGIDIHPGATIGAHFFIDHGTGVVIGETTVIGDHVKIYQGVTLGALSTRGGQKLRNVRRHPTIESRVTIYAGASILGGDTVIGQGATVGSNAFITSSVPAGARVHGPGL